MNNDEIKTAARLNRKELRCPFDGTLIGHYDARFGIINATFWCPKCRAEYTFTIKPQKNIEEKR